MRIRKKIIVAALSVTLALSTATPVMAVQVAATVKAATGWQAQHSYSLADHVFYNGFLSDEADYTQGVCVLDTMGQIHLMSDPGYAYAGGLGPDGQYYDPAGNRMNAMEYVRRKYLPKVLKAGENDTIHFQSRAELALFMNWYILHNSSQQGLTYNFTYSRNGTAAERRGISVKKSAFTQYANEFNEGYYAALDEDLAKVDRSVSFLEQMTQAVELVHRRFDYDKSYILADMNQAVADGKGVCYHYAKYLHDLLDKMEVESDYEVGRLTDSDSLDGTHVWNIITEPETGKRLYTDATISGFGVSLLQNPWLYLLKYQPAGVENDFLFVEDK